MPIIEWGLMDMNKSLIPKTAFEEYRETISILYNIKRIIAEDSDRKESIQPYAIYANNEKLVTSDVLIDKTSIPISKYLRNMAKSSLSIAKREYAKLIFGNHIPNYDLIGYTKFSTLSHLPALMNMDKISVENFYQFTHKGERENHIVIYQRSNPMVFALLPSDIIYLKSEEDLLREDLADLVNTICYTRIGEETRRLYEKYLNF